MGRPPLPRRLPQWLRLEELYMRRTGMGAEGAAALLWRALRTLRVTGDDVGSGRAGGARSRTVAMHVRSGGVLGAPPGLAVCSVLQAS